MSNVKHISEVMTRPDENLIALLEGALSRARAGEIVGAAIAEACSDGATQNVFYAAYPVRLIGELRILERDIIDLEIDTRAHRAGEEY